jgi:hypothetical protein
MPRTDTGNFDRLLTSLGLVLLGAALVIPYFFFGSTDTLEVPVRELREMTEAGRSSLLRRQETIVSLEPWVAAASIFLAAVGLLLLVAGAFRLRGAQAREDEEGELRRTRARLEVEEMSPAEKAAKVSEQAEREVEEEERVRPLPPAPRAPTLHSSRLRADAIARVTSRIGRVFANRDLGDYSLKPQLRIGSASEEIRLDGVFESAGGSPDVILKIRLSSDPSLLRKNAMHMANDLLDTISRYRGLTARGAVGWMVVVVPAEAAPDFGTGVRSWAIEPLATALHPFARLTVIGEGELGALPARFAELFITS